VGEISIEVLRAQTEEQRELCYRVRYDVFIRETGYIQHENGGGLETDGYDNLDTTFHFLAYYKGEPAGTVRLLLPNGDISRRQKSHFGLPIEELFDIGYYKTSDLYIAEISRSCVKERFQSTKTIFYLWRELIAFAEKLGITDLVTNVNPETDKLCDAYLVYDLVRLNDLVDRNITVNPKRPGIGKINGFRFPLTKGACCNNKGGRTEIKMPQTLKLFARVGSLFTGEPVYCEKIDMCAMPMNWKLKDIVRTPFGKFLKKEVLQGA
jgi:hypothetical protein